MKGKSAENRALSSLMGKWGWAALATVNVLVVF